MIKIYFDDVLIDSDNYAGISNNFKLFDDEFLLGTTTSNNFNIEVPYSALSSIPTNIKIKKDNKDYANLIVDDYQLKDNNIISLTLTDKMTVLNTPYDASSIVPCTIKEILKDICLKTGIELGTTDFDNSNEIIDFYDNTINAREYIGNIAELNSGYAIIGQDGKLYLKRFNSTPVNINIDDCEDFKVGQHHKIERVVFDNGILKYETSTDESLETLYLNSNNVFITSEKIFNNIANNILNFEFYCFETSNCPINSNVIAGDLINFTDGENNYQTIAQYSLDYNGDWIGGYNLNINSKHQEETKQQGLDTQVKKLSVELKRNENELRITAENTKVINEKLEDVYTKSQVEQLILNTESGLINTFTKSGGNNLLRNTALWNMKTEDEAEFWDGKIKQIEEDEAVSGYAILTQQGTVKQSVSLVPGTYSLSFKYKRIISASECSVRYNGKTFNLTEETGEIHTSGEINTKQFVIEITANSNNGFKIYDLILKHGNEGTENMLLWVQNANESKSDSVQIGEGIKATSNITNTEATMNSEGFQVQNKTTKKVVMKATATGGLFNDLTSTGNSTISGLIIRKSGTKVTLNGEV